MSLATATKEISEHPSKSAVTAPTDPKAQQADVEGKLRLYGVVQAFREGRMPTSAMTHRRFRGSQRLLSLESDRSE